MLGFRIEIVRYLGDEPQPGVVECRFDDARGRRWWFVEKAPIVSSEELRADTAYPRVGAIAGEVVERREDASDRAVVVIDTERPWSVTSVDGVSRFEVLESALIEW